MASWEYEAVGMLFGCLLLFVSGVNGEEAASNTVMETSLVIGGVAGVVILTVAIAICIDKRVHTELLDRGPPFWTRSLHHDPDYTGGLTAVSDGLDNLSQYHVVRRRLGATVTDGARWNKGFTEGKHVFEVNWPIKKNRGTFCSIGVGTMNVPIKKQGRLSLVGHHSQSWGLDLSSRKTVHANKPIGSFPRQIPDRFYMYLDLDGGKIGFGDDLKQFGREALFYGNLVTNIRLDRTNSLYLMIGMCAPKEEVQVFYVGSAVPTGGFDLCPPALTPEQQAAQFAVEGGQEAQLTTAGQEPV